MGENVVLLLLLLLPVVLFFFVRSFFHDMLPTMRSQKILSLIIGNGLIFMFLVTCVIFAGEIYFRFFVDGTDSFGLSKTTQRWFDRHYHRNRTGFRDSINYLPQPEPGRQRVSFLGDSFTAGHGVQDVEDRFANRVRRLLPEIEVHVLAECGLDTQKELELLAFLPESGYQTDFVVLVYCLNDISDIVPEWNACLERIYNRPAPGFFVRNSFLLNTIHSRIRIAQEPVIADYYGFVQSAYEGPIWQQHQLRLQQFKESTEANGARLLVVTFPFLHDLGPAYRYHGAHRRLGEFWKKLGVPHLDLLSVFEHQDPERVTLNARDAHPNIRAHEMAATAIAEFLRQEIKSGSPVSVDP